MTDIAKPTQQDLSLDAATLIQAARAEARLSDFGDDSFIEPLEALLACAARDVHFHPQGLEMFKHFYIVRCLVNRLRMQADLARHPEILDEDVSDPIIVIGLGRSGTTKLQKMLSAPDNVQKAVFWRLWNPARFPNAGSGEADARIEAANFSNLMTEDNAELNAAHRMAHTEVEEEWLLYTYTFADWIWTTLTPSLSYFDWVMARSSTRAYQYVKQMLQYLQWQDGGRRGRPWVLKSVGHIANLDALMACYPNATLVHAHRDPRQTLPSWTKFQSAGWALQSEPLAPEAAGQFTLHCFKTAMERYLEARGRLRLDDRILDVPYEQIRTDPMAVMARIYQHAHLQMDADAERAMRAWHDDNEQGKHGAHPYSLAEFGFTPEIIDHAFSAYIERFIQR